MSIDIDAENPDAARKLFKQRHPELLITKVKQVRETQPEIAQ